MRKDNWKFQVCALVAFTHLALVSKQTASPSTSLLDRFY